VPRVLVFDLNGTLTDLSKLDPLFVDALGSASLRNEWFFELIQLAMTSTLTGHHIPFSKMAGAGLDVVAARAGKRIDERQRSRILEATRNVPAFPDVEPALRRLQAAGFRLAVLTNSTADGAESTLSAAGLRGYFEKVMSVDAVQKYKPSPEVYRMAARELGIATAEMMLIAAHAWDTTGAIRAGCRAAFIQRPGEVLDPLAPAPVVIARDLLDLCDQLLKANAA